MQCLAAEREGWCRSTIYINAYFKLLWQCKEMHSVFSRSPTSVKSGHWCPTCSTNVSENICRQYFEALFNEKFDRVRPKWLVSLNNGRAELDGYCEKLKLAFEYQGVQHYKQTSDVLFKTRSLDEQIRADENKRDICKKNGVVCIEIPYTIAHKHIGEYIIGECKRLGIYVPKSDLTRIDYKKFNCYQTVKMEKISNILKQRGFECLSKNYIDNVTKLKVRCRNGHPIELSPGKIIAGVGCSICSKKKKGTIEEIQELAKRNNFICLSSDYVNAYSDLEFRCLLCGYSWRANSTHIKSGTGCPVCKKKIAAVKSGNTRRKYTIEYMKAFAANKHGKCNSEIRVDGGIKFEFECFLGDTWLADPYRVIGGQWCPICAIENRKRTKRLNFIARTSTPCSIDLEK
jgi:hypothetical protein